MKKLILIALLCTLIIGVYPQTARAASTILKVDVSGGALTLSNPTVATLSAASLEGSQNVSRGKLGSIEIVDNRGTGSGWTVTLAVSDFSCCNGGFTIPASNLTITPASITTIAGSATGLTAGSVYTFKSSSDIATILSANSTAGMGSYSINPDISLIIPANAYAGTYSATLTLTII